MNREAIEIIALSKLKTKISLLEYTIPEIPDNDKSPSWDGFIKLYEKRNQAGKQNLIRIPVQVKGHYETPPYSDYITFSIEKYDLENYLNERGCIFFVIYIDENENYKIYFQNLTRLKIRRILKGKENQKHISIQLEKFPDDKDSALDIFFNFVSDMELNFPNQDITIADVFEGKLKGSGFDSFNISYHGVKYKNDPWGAFINTKPTLCLKNSVAGIIIPIETDYEVILMSKGTAPVSINNIKYYDDFEIIRKQGEKFSVNLGKSFKIDFNGTNAKFHYETKGNLHERIQDTKFIISLLSNKEIRIGNCSLKCPLGENEQKLINAKYFENNLRLLEYVRDLLEKLKVQTILNYDAVTKDDEILLIKLINIVLLGASCIPDKKNVLYKLQIANINLLLMPEKEDEQNYKIINFFSDENKMLYSWASKEERKMILVPKSYILNADDFMMLDNIDYEIVYNDIINSQTSDELKEYTFYFIKDMIDGYKRREKIKDNLLNCINKSLAFLKNTVREYNYEKLEKELIEYSK